MEASASLKQTLTHLFDAVRFADHARQLEESASTAEGDLETALSKLEARTEEINNLLASMKEDSESVLKDFSKQLEGFLTTAKDQAKGKLQKKAKEELEDYRSITASEKDKALKSLEAYFASDPLPIIENVIQVRLLEGIYEARSRCECEGGIKYDFRLAAQNSKLFHQPLSLSELGYEVKVPVRFSRALLSKSRVPGFERLDQYILASAESSGERLRAGFEKSGNGSKMKVITSGHKNDGFVGLEYSDQVQSVNVMNDPSLVGYVDLEVIKKAAAEIVTELAELSKKKMALLRFSLKVEEVLDDVDYREVLQNVMSVMGPAYRELLKKLAAAGPAASSNGDLTLKFIQDRMKVLGAELSKSVSQALGLPGSQQ
jgi:uncharacterized protein YeeX (DUF496 family)